MAGWPTTEVCLSLVAVIIGLGSTAPDPRDFTTLAVFAMPIACLLAGILKYFVFNGVSEFPLLAIGLAPVVIGLALLIALPNRHAVVARPALPGLHHGHPRAEQSAELRPAVLCDRALFSCLSSILAFAAQLLLPSLSGERRIRLLLDDVPIAT